MAIGIAKLFGFSLMQNFAYPYFSRDITEFWKTMAYFTNNMVP